MSYILRNVVNSDERMVYSTRLHWVYLIKGLMWAALFVGFAAAIWRGMELAGMRAGRAMTHVDILGYDLGPVAWWLCGVMVFIGVLLLLTHVINYFFTELAITSIRVVYKTGMISTTVEEIGLAEIESETVRSGWLGNIFDYGGIVLDCRFVGDVALPKIRKPYKFVRMIHRMRAQLPKAPVVA